jgi:hypothetical protein
LSIFLRQFANLLSSNGTVLSQGQSYAFGAWLLKPKRITRPAGNARRTSVSICASKLLTGRLPEDKDRLCSANWSLNLLVNLVGAAGFEPAT